VGSGPARGPRAERGLGVDLMHPFDNWMKSFRNAGTQLAAIPLRS
jgi:hypothetical protein